MLTILTPSTATLVTLAELKAHLAIEHNLDDTRLTMLLENATALIEADANSALTPQTWLQTDACFGRPHIIDKAPVIGISVKYYSADNVLTTLTSSAYYSVKTSQDCRLTPVDSWPSTYSRPDAVQVTLTLGTVPKQAKMACLLKVAQWNEDREGTTAEAREYDRLINSIRVGRVC